MQQHVMTLLDPFGKPEWHVLLSDAGLVIQNTEMSLVTFDLEQLLALNQFLWAYKDRINAAIREERSRHAQNA